MNTLAKLYKQTQALFYTNPSSDHINILIAELQSSFALDPYPVVTVDLINQKDVKEAQKVFWKSLEAYGLSLHFQARKQDNYAYVILAASPVFPHPFAGAFVIEHSTQEFKVAA